MVVSTTLITLNRNEIWNSFVEVCALYPVSCSLIYNLGSFLNLIFGHTVQVFDWRVLNL